MIKLTVKGEHVEEVMIQLELLYAALRRQNPVLSVEADPADMDAGVPHAHYPAEDDASADKPASPVRATHKKKEEAKRLGAALKPLPPEWEDNETLATIHKEAIQEAQAEKDLADMAAQDVDTSAQRDDALKDTECPGDDVPPALEAVDITALSDAIDQSMNKLGHAETRDIMTDSCNGTFKRGRDMDDDERSRTYNAIREALAA